jgi:hypothetical protein
VLSPTYLLIETRKLYDPFNLELDYGLPSKFFKVLMVVIGLENNGGDIKEFSNSITLSFLTTFSFSISPFENFKASLVASWNFMTLEGGTH